MSVSTIRVAGIAAIDGRALATPAPLESLRSPILVPALLCGLLAAALSYESITPGAAVIVALIVAAFVLALPDRSWAVVPVLLVELSISNLILESMGLSLRLLVVLIAAALTLPALLKVIAHPDAAARRVLWPAATFLLLATAGNALHSDGDYVLKYLRFQAAQLIGLMLVAALIRSRRDLMRLMLAALAICTASGAAAVWQHFDRASAPYGMQSAAAVTQWNGRSMGLADNPVLLANHLTFALVPALAILLLGRPEPSRRWAMLGIAILLMAGGLYFTFTRSAFFALAPGVAAMGLCMSGPRRTAVLGLVAGAGLAFQLLQGTGIIGERYYRDATTDRSAASHEALWQVGLAIALDNWVIGVGHQAFEGLTAEYAETVAPTTSPDGISVGEAAAGQRPHNDFLNVWMSWGILALLAYLALFVGTIQNFYVAARCQEQLVRWLGVGGVGAMTVYAVNSAYHNYMDSSAVLWLLGGLSVTLVTLPAAATDRGAALRRAIVTPASFVRRVGLSRRRGGRPRPHLHPPPPLASSAAYSGRTA